MGSFCLVGSDSVGPGSIEPVVSEASDRVRLLDEIEHDLTGVSKAMERLDAGTYAECEVCANPIGDDRLRSLPLAARCGTCPPA
jgi:RNA polymerase-binding transcription factor DksA